MDSCFFEIEFQDDDFKFAERDHVEQSLRLALAEAMLGKVSGRGFDANSCFIDVQINNFDAGLALIRSVLNGLGVALSTAINYYPPEENAVHYRLQE